jgi:hypothetical protein
VPTAILAAKKPRNVLKFIKTPQGFVLLKKRVVLVNYLVVDGWWFVVGGHSTT